MKKMVKSAALAAAFVAGAGAASAATITFTPPGAQSQGGGAYTEGAFTFDEVRIVGGNCPTSEPRCAGLNIGETSVLTAAGNAPFDFDSVAVKLQGNNAALTLTSDLGGVYVVSGPAQTAGTFDLTGVAGFAGVSAVTFSFTASGGNTRFDNIEVSPVPLPAAGALLLAGLGGLALRRTRS